MLLAHLLRYLVRKGTLRVVDSTGKTHVFSGEPGPSLSIRIKTRAAERKIALHPTLYTGETFMDGTLTVDDGGAFELLDFFILNTASIPKSILTPLYDGLGHRFRWLQQYNPLDRSRRNVAHHYDLSDRLYDLFLEADRQYSCAYFSDPQTSLEQAQANKKRHLAAKLLLEPGMKVLDIGCGWGGLALYLAQECEVEVTGLTLSVEQLKVAQRRAAELGLSDRVKFELVDYRNAEGSYDRIVSVGMFEHVGLKNLPVYFGALRRLLAADGAVLNHGITAVDTRHREVGLGAGADVEIGWDEALATLDLWLVVREMAEAGLEVMDVETLRLHYARTLHDWSARLEARFAEARRLAGDRRARIWRLYLAGCAHAFARNWVTIHQVLAVKCADPSRAALPLTRDDVYA